jgi:small subunit ribosomal protein S8e
MTKLDSSKRIHTVRVRGGNTKHRALRLDTGNFAWGSESITRKTRLIQVVSRLPLQSGRNRAGSKEDSRVEI